MHSLHFSNHFILVRGPSLYGACTSNTGHQSIPYKHEVSKRMLIHSRLVLLNEGGVALCRRCSAAEGVCTHR